MRPRARCDGYDLGGASADCRLEPRDFAKGEAVYRAGDPPGGVWALGLTLAAFGLLLGAFGSGMTLRRFLRV